MNDTKNGNAPATKDDLRELELTMLAGFQLCMEELKIIEGFLAAMQPSVSKRTLEDLIMAQRVRFDQQMRIAREQILELKNQEKCD